MLTKLLFKKAFWLLVLTGILNWAAYELYLYWTVWWADVITHFIGGVSLGYAVLWLYSYTNDFKKSNLKRILVITLVGTIFVGVFWELVELYIKATSLLDGIDYWTDTLSDLLMDILGGLLAYRNTARIIKKYE